MRTFEESLREIEALQRSLDGTDRPGQKAEEILAAMRVAVEEMNVAQEEMAQQNEELLEARVQIEAERQRYRELFERAPDGYLVTDPAGIVVEANRPAARMLDRPPERLKGKPLLVSIGKKDRRRFLEALASLRAGEPVQDLEVELAPGGEGAEAVPVQISASRHPGSYGTPESLLWLVRDVRERKRAEAELAASQERLHHLEKLQAVGRLAGGVAHSFNNLLTAIACDTELILSRLAEGDPVRKHVEAVEHAVERGGTLARQLLAFGRRQVPQPQVLKLDRVVAEMEEMLRRLVGERIAVEVDLDPATPPVCADPSQMEQVVLNLVANARDAMPKGGRLTIRTGAARNENEAAEQAEAVLEVSDTGHGLPKEIREHLFEPFFTTKERGEGTGLGLATIHGVVQQSGGRIEVATQPGVGTTFRIHLPAYQGTETAPQPGARRAPASPHEGNGMAETILLVEDEENIRRPVTEILEDRGYLVLPAADATEALAVAEGHDGPIHLLVTDVIMPGRSGKELAHELAARRPDVRVLFTTGYPGDVLDEDAPAAAGGPQVLKKPFTGQILTDKIREMLDEE